MHAGKINILTKQQSGLNTEIHLAWQVSRRLICFYEQCSNNIFFSTFIKLYTRFPIFQIIIIKGIITIRSCLPCNQQFTV